MRTASTIIVQKKFAFYDFALSSIFRFFVANHLLAAFMVLKTSSDRKLENLILFPIFFLILSFYIVYEQATSSLAIGMAEQLARHKRMLSGASEFYNPWQYRIFSTYIVELFVATFSKISFINNPYLPYFFVRFMQNILIFAIAYKYYRALNLNSRYLIIFGILILGYNMSNSVFMSDLSVNTYFDILFYLIAGYLVLTKKNIWILPLMLVAAFNRETSALIPFMLIVPAIDYTTFKLVDKEALYIGLGALLIFLVIFVSLRIHYGMPPSTGIHGMSSPLDFLKFNFTFFRMYPQLFGTLGIIPLLVIFKFRQLSPPLKVFFLIVIPVWFIIHFAKSQAMETRLFLVPQALIFIPAILQIIEKELTGQQYNKS